jgi:hypothetical protein
MGMILNTQTAQPAPATPNSSNFLESILPGISKLTTGATDAVGDLINGLPSPSQARTTNAYWGVGAGTPAGGAGSTGDINSFIGRRGTDLYGQQAKQNQQTGITDLLNMIGGYSAPALTNQGQQLQNNQFFANLGQQGSQFDQNYQLNKFQAMLQALGLGQQINGQNQQNIQL